MSRPWSFGVAAERAEFDGFYSSGVTRRGRRRPAGTEHAYQPTAESTLCGLPLDQLVVFPERTFAAKRSSRLCSDCLAESYTDPG